MAFFNFGRRARVGRIETLVQSDRPFPPPAPRSPLGSIIGRILCGVGSHDPWQLIRGVDRQEWAQSSRCRRCGRRVG